MKRSILLAMMILGISLCANAQEEQAQNRKKVAISFGPEWNMSSPQYFAGGIVLGFHYNISRFLAIGLTLSGSSDFFGFYVIEEPALLFRWYSLENRHSGTFFEVDVGRSLAVKDGEVSPYFLGGLRGGYRLPLGSSFFIEPYGRVGYPFAFGIGVLGGIHF